MAREKKFFVLKPVYKIYDAGGDLTKKWFIYWYEGGKRVRKYISNSKFTTIKSRRKALHKLLKELKAGEKRKVSRLEEALLHYLEVNRNVWRNGTYNKNKSITNKFLQYIGGRELTKALNEEFYIYLKGARHPNTYNKYLDFLKRPLTDMGYEYYFEDIHRLKAISTPARYFQKFQAKRLLEHIDAKDPELGLFIRFIYYCFIRPNELRQLKVGDILFDENQIRIPGSISKNKKTQFVVVPKVFLPFLDELKMKGPGEYIFPSKRDAEKHISKNDMYERHKKFLKELGFGTDYKLYSWKHTGAVSAAKAGISVKELQLQLRHHSLDETDKYLRQMGVKDLSKLAENFPNIS